MSFYINLIGSEKLLLLKRHFNIILRYLTLKKAGNILLAIHDFANRKEIPIAKPVYIKVEPTRLCNLRCLGCLHSSENYSNHVGDDGHLKIEDFKRIIEPISDFLLGISFAFLGEPFLNKSLVKMVDYAHKKNIGTMFPTNLSIHISNDKAKEIATSGLDMLMISLDGATSETYSRYRIGGNFDLVLENVAKIKEAKYQSGSRHPDLRWKFTVFDHNKHEIDLVKQSYKKLGFDTFSIQNDMYNLKGKKKKIRNKYSINLMNKKTACFWLWFTLIIEYNGNVSPCCGIHNLFTIDTFNLGNVLNTQVLDIWNGNGYQQLRNGFKKSEPLTKLHPTCKKCIGLLNESMENI